MPEMISLPTLMLVHMWYEESTLGECLIVKKVVTILPHLTLELEGLRSNEDRMEENSSWKMANAMDGNGHFW